MTYRLIQSGRFQKWLDGLGDARARYRIAQRLERVQLGNFGDHRSVGKGVSELRIDYGPGYRVYYVVRGSEVVLLLAGGTKASQRSDIVVAQELAAIL